MRAYCFANGRIEFGVAAPKGAILFAMGPASKLRNLIEPLARHAYDGQTLLVPGVPEAPNQDVGVKKLRQWCDWIKSHPLPRDVRVL